MSFRGDDHYGSVPPIQYPVHPTQQSRQQQQQQQQQHTSNRRLSFDAADDRKSNSHHCSHATRDNASNGPNFVQAPVPAGADELFLTSTMASTTSASPLANFQHRAHISDPQVNPQAMYNPQTFASNHAPSASAVATFSRSRSTNPSYHSHSSSSLLQSQQQPATVPLSYATSLPPSHGPQSYNPAAYAYTTNPPHRQRAHHSYSSYDATNTYGQSSIHSQAPHSPSYQPPTHSPTTSYSPTQLPTPTTYDPSNYLPSYSTYPTNDLGQPNTPQYGAVAAASYPTASQIPVGPAYYDSELSYNNQPARLGSQSSQRDGSSHPQQPVSSGLRRHPTNAPLPSRPAEDRDTTERITTDTILQEIESAMDDAADDDDDDEAVAGTIALQHANQDMAANHQYGASFGYSDVPPMPDDSKSLPPHPEEPNFSSDESEYDVDISRLAGGYEPTPQYENNTEAPPPGSSSGQRPLPTPSYFDNLRSGYQDAPGFGHAGIDYGDTGGLQLPTRRSFDSGPDHVSIDSRHSGGESPMQDGCQDLFFHPGLTNRPLPPPPGSDSSSLLSAQNSVRQLQRPHSHSHSQTTDGRPYRPEGLESYYTGRSQCPQPERSISLSHESMSPVHKPHRSKTDGAEDRKRQGHRSASSFSGSGPVDRELALSSMGAFDGITLPTGRKKKFVPARLGPADFLQCSEPWALSNVELWLREMALGEADLRSKTVEDGLTALFTFKIPTMNVADAEVLSSYVLATMLKARVLLPEEEWVKLGDGHISGVLWQLTGTGCYAPKLHEYNTPGRCYSMHCTRTLKKVDLDVLSDESKPTDEWHTFYHLKKEDWESKPKEEVARQNMLHEIVYGEENYIKQLDIFRTLYHDDLRTRQPPIIHPDKRDKFLASVFGKIDTVLAINKGHLLAQLKYRQQEQGPWIVGFSDIFREWIRKAKAVYVDYATGYPRATYMVRKEKSRNLLFRKFLEDKQKHKSSSKQDWTHFLITPLQRLQRYILLLESVEQKMVGESEEKTNLQKAIQEVKAVTHECDAKVAETNKRVEMMELDRMLVLRPGFQSVLNLDHLGRALILQGDLQRLSSKGMRWVDTHALLFDHYFILAKVVQSKEGKSDKKYDVSREPIPMPLLFLESNNEEPIVKQKGITRTAPAGAASAQLNKTNSNGSGKTGLEHSSTGSSSIIAGPSQPIDVAEGKILYPFKVKHLGHEVYTLYASSARDRLEWCSRIIEAKTMHAKALFSQNAEPFRLRVLADASFHYDSGSSHSRGVGVSVTGTPLDRAIQNLESVLGSAQGVAPVCRAQVNCAAGFSALGKTLIAIGTDYGVYISDSSNPRGWTRTIQVAKVSQLAVLEDFNVCLIIAEKSLLSFPLDVVAPVSEFAPPLSDNSRRAPQRLARDVTYFATARMKDRTLVFYKRKEGLHTSFKVVEPLYHKATEKRSRIFGGRKSAAGSTDTFRDFDEFFFPTECYSLSIFQTYIAVATTKGIEMLTLDRKQPMSIPDLKAPAIANIASRIRDRKPLGMFRLNENEFILTYEDCAVYVDKHGDVSRTHIMEYTGKQKRARGATIYGQYLLLFNEDYVEVRNADNGRLRQIIAGRDVRVIDCGIRGPTGENAAQSQHLHGQNGQLATAGDMSKGTVKVVMAHPELAGRQLIFEMLLNDGHLES